MFSRQAELVFQPGNERLSIKQQFKGIDEHDHLVVDTELEGRVPAVPLGSSVEIKPYKEIYQYDRNREDQHIYICVRIKTRMYSPTGCKRVFFSSSSQ